MADTKPLYQTRFEAAVSVIQSLPKNGSFQPSNEMMLKFYSFYKQATLGPCNTSKPQFWDPVGRYKWDAWSALGDMSKEDAMIAYVEEMKKILETIPMTEKVEELLQVIGPFYELVDDKKHGRGSGVSSVRLDKVTKSLEELSSALTSTPNFKAVNGKTESSDSGAESQEEGTARHESDDEEGEEEEEEESEKEEQEQDSAVQTTPKTAVANGLLMNHSDYISDMANYTPTKSSLNEANDEMDVNEKKLDAVDVEGPLERGDEEDCPDDLVAMQHLTSDSDSEIFCDSMEQFGQEEVDHSQLLEDAMLSDDAMETSAGDAKKYGGDDKHPSSRTPQREKFGSEKSGYTSSRRGKVSHTNRMGDGFRGGQMDSGGDGEHWGSERSPSDSLTEQINVVLMRLQEDMQNVLQRLHTLESLTASQAKSLAVESSYRKPAKKRPSWWPFGISPGTAAFAIIWPFVAHWLMNAYLQRKRRKLT
ncbi:acyl-CoA-binding domain-containing protein 5 isoform X3 [Pelobates fuscus]|uniref:acyl-CoA-binding domain-containing protein 5 isoform X3 n=1 Tax=Pelobates fuscus TaxID=191477 RepID=UPI002FE487D6